MAEVNKSMCDTVADARRDLEEYRACRDKLCQQLETFYEDFVTRLLVFDNTLQPPPFQRGNRPQP